MNLTEMPLGELARTIPGATRIFHACRLDFCCGGKKTLDEAARRRGLDPQRVAAELAALSALGRRTDTDWAAADNATLIGHILQRYHVTHREQLPELIRLARRVEQVHGDRADCPAGLADHLETMLHELDSHMMKEEQILFPMLARTTPGLVDGPISVMRHEHDQHARALAALDVLTHDITPPDDACNTWRALYTGLAQLREDLMEHIHLENNILFEERRIEAG
ncbi:MAG: iron-sulfur cluster repair protein YtfE [Methyloversatilis sp.]|jgi:regulator of cell morphogenesis and NO signaling|nr:iron-sulfur cluster repair protein YtfE [Methyloversatilis sp.]